MKLKHTPDSVCDISEEDFWSAFKSIDGADGELLANAVELGRGGKKRQAYARLAEYLRASLREEWQWRRDKILTEPATHQTERGQTPEDILRNRINVWHDTVVEFGDKIDWDYNLTDKYGFHYLFWLRPGTRRLMEGGEEVYRRHLTEIITSYYRARNRLQHPNASIHLVYYELGSWAKLKQLLPLYLELINTGDLPTAAHEAFMKLFLGFGRSLYRLQKSYRGGNWQIVGCAGLLTLARAFPLRESGRWEKRAMKYLLEHLKRDYDADGCHGERCWGYGYMSLGGIVEAYQMAQRHGGLGPHAAAFRRAVRKAFRWFASTLGPKER